LEVRGSKWETMYRVTETQVNVQDKEDIRIPLWDMSIEEMSPLLMRCKMGLVDVRKIWVGLEVRGSKWETMYKVAETQVNVQDREDIRIPLWDMSMEERSPLLMRSEMGYVDVRKIWLGLEVRWSK
jgi:hypothetical protein